MQAEYCSLNRRCFLLSCQYQVNAIYVTERHNQQILKLPCLSKYNSSSDILQQNRSTIRQNRVLTHTRLKSWDSCFSDHCVAARTSVLHGLHRRKFPYALRQLFFPPAMGYNILHSTTVQQLFLQTGEETEIPIKFPFFSHSHFFCSVSSSDFMLLLF